MEKNLRKLVEDELTYGRHHEVIGSFTNLERQLYESQDYEWTASGFLVKKKDIQDIDYTWEVLDFIQSNPDIKESITYMLDSGERLLRAIYVDRDSFLLWMDFFDRLNAEGFCVGDHVDINEELSKPMQSEDAMSYIDTGFSIETVGERSIYHVDFEEEESQDQLGDLIDPYHTYYNPPRDKYRTVSFIGYNEEDPDGIADAARREENLRNILRKIRGLKHRASVAVYRQELAAHWEEDKDVYKRLKEKEITISEASDEMFLTANQWKEAFTSLDQAWKYACAYDEHYFSKEQKMRRMKRSNKLRDSYKVKVLNCTEVESLTNIMRHFNGMYKINQVWKNDYKEVYNLAVLQYKRLINK